MGALPLPDITVGEMGTFKLFPADQVKALLQGYCQGVQTSLPYPIIIF
jgi:hypothetical protein